MMMKFLILEIKDLWFIERSKNEGGVRPFGSLEKFYENDFVWLNHSINPSHIKKTIFV